MRLPFLDSQTGVAQNNCYIWMEKTHRGPGGTLSGGVGGSQLCLAPVPRPPQEEEWRERGQLGKWREGKFPFIRTRAWMGPRSSSSIPPSYWKGSPEGPQPCCSQLWGVSLQSGGLSSPLCSWPGSLDAPERLSSAASWGSQGRGGWHPFLAPTGTSPVKPEWAGQEEDGRTPKVIELAWLEPSVFPQAWLQGRSTRTRLAAGARSGG